jgi:hypothetical protein
MKTLLVLLAAVSLSHADQGADAFVTGFANGLNQAVYHQQNTNNAQQVNVTYTPVRTYVATPGHPLNHYDAVNDQGTPAGMIFSTYGSCRRYANQSDGAWVDCIPAE